MRLITNGKDITFLEITGGYVNLDHITAITEDEHGCAVLWLGEKKWPTNELLAAFFDFIGCNFIQESGEVPF